MPESRVNTMPGNPDGPGTIIADTKIPDGIYGSFVLAVRLEVKNGRVLAIKPDGIDYALCCEERPGHLVVSMVGRPIKEREKYPSWPLPEPEG